MRPRLGATLGSLAALAWTPAWTSLWTPAWAAEPITPPAMYPPDTWQGRSAAIVRVLDRLDAHVETLTVPAGQSGSYKSLSIAVRSCLERPPGLPPDATSALTVTDGHAASAAFQGWMYSAEPFLAVFQSPVFGVQLVSCAGAAAPPAAPPLQQPPPPSLNLPAAAPEAEPSPVYPSGAPDNPSPPDDNSPPPDPSAPASPDGPPPSD